MGIGYNTSVVRDGLVFYLDAANLKSYPGTGTTWFDLKNQYNSTIVGPSISFNSDNKFFDVAGNQTNSYIQLPHLALQSLSDGYEWTIETVLSIDSLSGTTYFHSVAITGNDNLYLVQKNTVIQPWNTVLANGSAINFQQGEIMLLTITHSGSNQYFFKNGIYFGSWNTANDISTAQAWVLNQEQDSLLGGFSSSQATGMNVYSVKLYDRPLTDEEIKLNYESMRGRYGI